MKNGAATTKGESMIKGLIKLALGKGIKTTEIKKASDELQAGTYQVDQIVRVRGTVTKGEDYEQIVHMTIPHWKIISVLFSKVNDATMESVIREAVGLSSEDETKIKAAAQAAAETVKASGKKMVAGKVTTKLTFEPVTLGSVQEKEQAESEAVIA
jgi:hypothetical protein